MSSDNHFPHDGEHGRSCTGYGCNCDEKNYGYHSGDRSDGGGNGGAWAFIGSIIGAMNELIAAILIVVVTFIFVMCK